MDSLAGIDLNLLVALHHLLEAASVTDAAAALGVQQPAMSASLGRLREALADPLLVRAGRGMRRTDRAEALRVPVSELVDRARALLVPLAPFNPATDAFTARVAISDETRDWLGPRLVARVRAEAPAVDLRLRRLTLDSVGAGRSGALDLAVFPEPTGNPGGQAPDLGAFVVRPLYTTRFVVASADRQVAWSMAEYAAADHVLVVGWNDTDVGFADEILALHGLTRRVALTVPTFREAIALVLQHASLVTLMPEVLAVGTALCTLPLPWGDLLMQVQYAFHPRSARDPRLRWLRSVLEAAAADVPRAG